LTLPDSGIVEKLKLNALTSLTMTNLTMLEKENISLDEDIFTKMNSLTIKNCPAMDEYSYRMALQAPMTNYALTDFNWVVNSVEDLEIEDGIVVGIKVVDKLRTKLPNNKTHAASLIGTIHIDVPTANINEYEIYSKYC
jgi:hypothetical protein